MATLLWDQLRLDAVWLPPPPSREGASWLNILKTLAGSQLPAANGDLLGEDIALAQPNNPYRCLDKFTAHKQAMFTCKILDLVHRTMSDFAIHPTGRG